MTTWKAHSQTVRGRFYLSLCMFSVSMAVTTTVLLDMPIGHPGRGGELMTFMLGLIGTVSTNERTHQSLVVIALLFAAFALTTLAARPGSLT